MIKQTLLTLALIGAAGMATAQTQQTTPSPDYQQMPSMQPSQQAQMVPSSGACGHQEAMKDEYGFRYDAQGNRLNGQGCVIPAPVSKP